MTWPYPPILQIPIIHQARNVCWRIATIDCRIDFANIKSRTRQSCDDVTERKSHSRNEVWRCDNKWTWGIVCQAPKTDHVYILSTVSSALWNSRKPLLWILCVVILFHMMVGFHLRSIIPEFNIQINGICIYFVNFIYLTNLATLMNTFITICTTQFDDVHCITNEYWCSEWWS